MDGISKELDSFFDNIATIGEEAIQATKEVIDEATEQVYNGIRQDVPVKTGGLRDSIKCTKVDGGDWYGYDIEFEGNAPNGEPYQKIANILNYGVPASENSGGVSGRHFVANNIKKLKGLNDKIEARISAKIAQHNT